MDKYGESKTTRIMMATVRHVTSGEGRTKFQVAWYLLQGVVQYWKHKMKDYEFKLYVLYTRSTQLTYVYQLIG